jgi:hypothetical protein
MEANGACCRGQAGRGHERNMLLATARRGKPSGLAFKRHRQLAMEQFDPALVRHPRAGSSPAPEEDSMNGIIYLVGLIVVIMAILSFLGLR